MFFYCLTFTGYKRLKALEKESPATMIPQSTTSIVDNLAGINDLSPSSKFPSLIPYIYQPWAANFQGANLPYLLQWSHWAQQRSVPLQFYDTNETSSDETTVNGKT